jgi:hypothetical protein
MRDDQYPWSCVAAGAPGEALPGVALPGVPFADGADAAVDGGGATGLGSGFRFVLV